MKKRSRSKKLLIALLVLVIAAGAGAGIWYASAGTGAEPVKVFEFNYVGMTEYWGDSQESYGRVETDKIQTVYLSTTQTVTEIFVSQGDQVKKGDVLMSFDTTLTDLSLERKRLDVEKLKLQLQDAKKRLAQVNAMRPMVIPSVTEDEEEEEDLGTALTGKYQISTDSGYDGSTVEKAMICWLHTDTAIDNDLLDALILKAEAYQQKNAPKTGGTAGASARTAQTEQPAQTTEPPTQPPAVTTVPPTQPPAETTEPPTQPPAETTVPPTQPPAVTTVPPTQPPAETTEPPTQPPAETTEPPTQPPAETTEPPTEPPAETTEPPTEPPSEPTEPTTEPTEPPLDVSISRFYVVFKVTEDNMSLGNRITWQGVLALRDRSTGEYKLRFFDASSVQDHTLSPEDAENQTPEIDYGSGYTAAQIAQMRSEQEKAIKDLEFSIKMAEAEYKIMQTEISDGNVYAQIDGTVVSQISAEEAQMLQQPILKISGGGGFFVEGSISELEKDSMELGQEVTINDWNTGMTYTGTVRSMGDYPSTGSYWSGAGNPTATYYPFLVFVDETADLQEGSYVSIVYSAGTSQHGVYLQNPFLRTENGRSYIFVQGADGKLEQRYVTTGKSLWGSYTEILDGLTETDYVAFPYGKTVKPGADTVQADISELYE